ncbi:hypothetical protein SDC9_98142 [bioreactor metagenome]|uniref:Uncharacterized protein n=1 Tax=bioreactor metagenome TaxID=1076179 RepID=A0A645AP65_9ZZZZ
MNGALDLAAVGGIAAAGFRVVHGAQRGNVPRGVFFHAGAPDEVAVTQPDLTVGRETEIAFDRRFHEVGTLDVDFPGKRHLPRPGRGVFRIVDRVEILDLPLRVVFDHHFERIEHGQITRRLTVEFFAHAVLEKSHVGDGVELGHADQFAEIAHRRRRNAAPAQARNRGHPGIVPARNMMIAHQFEQFALAHHRVVQIEPRKLGLDRGVRPVERLQQPVVERPVNFEFQSAERVGDTLDRVFDRMREIVHRIDAPLVALPEMVDPADAVNDRVAHVNVGRRHIDPGAQHHRAVLEFTGAHPGEKIEVFRHRTQPARRFLARIGQVAAIRFPRFGRQIADIGEPFADQGLRAFVHFFEVVAGEIEVFAPVEAEPVDVVDDRLDILHVFLGRIGVVHPQMADAAEFLGDAEVEADRLDVADVQIAVGLGWETGFHPAAAEPGRHVGPDQVANEITRFGIGIAVQYFVRHDACQAFQYPVDQRLIAFSM